MKKEIRIDELRVMMLDALALRGIGSEDADFIVDDFLDAELEGHKTHGTSPRGRLPRSAQNSLKSMASASSR